MIQTHFFLGTNSADGFFGYYDQLLDAQLDDLAILKGGAGCGKSTLMRRVADALSARGEDTVYIHCSGDPDSLDGVLFPRLRAGLVDGTAPHVLEPRCMAAHERYVNFSPCYDLTHARELSAELRAATEDYRAAYREAYHVLRALGGIDAERRALACSGLDREKLLRRAAGMAARELKGRRTGMGRTQRAFLGGATAQGVLCRYDTAETLCPRIFELNDSYGLAAPLLTLLHRETTAAGEDAIVCCDPLRPTVPQHLLLPTRGIAFVSTTRPYPRKPYRRVRIDAMAEGGLSRAQRAHLRFLRRLCASLEEEAVSALARAKAKHDALEALYRPCIDLTRVDALCAEELARAVAKIEGLQ